MPKSHKRRATGAGAHQDSFREEWHINRTQAVIGDDGGTGVGNEEFTIICPRPLEPAPAGRWWAIEIHSIEYLIGAHDVAHATHNGEFFIQWAMTTASRIGKAPFITSPGNPDNIWFNLMWIKREANTGTEAVYITEQTRHDNLATYTDDMGHGKLLIGDKIYLQVATGVPNGYGSFSDPSDIHLAIEYTWATVSCPEVVQELASQLQTT